jgi:hypothetical protein
MQPVKPNLGKGEEPELSTGLTVAVFNNAEVEGGRFVVSRWELNYEEREAIRRGKDLYLIQSIRGETLDPCVLIVGAPSFDGAVMDATGDSSETLPTDSEGPEETFKSRDSELL